MKLRLLILLAAAALAAAPAAGQTVKSLGYNTTNGQIVYSGSNSLTFTNALQFSTNARAATRTNLGGTSVGNSVFTATNAAAAATAIGLGTTNDVTFQKIEVNGNVVNGSGFFYSGDANVGLNLEEAWIQDFSSNNVLYWGNSTNLEVGRPINFGTNVATTRTNLGLGAANNVTFSNITASGTLTATGNATLNGSDNLMPNATNAASAASLMTRELGDNHYLGEFWHAWRMSAYGTTTIPVGVFKTAPCVLYTNGQSAFYVEAFIDPSKYAGKTVRVLAYCRVDSTNGGNVQGFGQVKYLTNTAGGPDPDYPITVGGQGHGSIGVFTNANTDVFPVATSTNQYLIFTSNVGTIPTNAKMIIAAFGFDRASTNTTYTNGNLYMQAVQLVVENP